MMVRVPTLLATCALLACSEDRSHPPNAGGCNDPSCAQPPGPGGGGGGTDAGRDALADATDAVSDAGDAAVTAIGAVRLLTRFTADVAGEAVRTVFVRAPKVGGGLVEGDTSAGTFTLPNVQATIGGPTWLQVVTSGATRELRGIDGVQLGSGTAELALFDNTLPQSTWITLGVGTPYPAGAATVVVHVHDFKTGARKPGVTAAAFGDGKGPFYDDGADTSASAKATGARGTIVFLGITPSSLFNLTLSDATKTYSTVTIPLGANAVSWIALGLE
ncbi:MAG: hypothetical protein HYV09_09805 [Deltaproteobacteria bacterium]|nr:hypothetical protein [Deltaproteobacteria bacterium]